MGRNDRWKNGWELVLIPALIYAVSAAPTCREDQKLRRNENDVICCYTARCNTSQKFEFCKQDQGRDICVNCPPGTYTNDKINTAQWDEESDFCVPIPLCNSDEVISIGNECACNLAKGYWGVDSRNCQLDKYNCKRAGHQLRQKDGVCISCDEDKFKPEDGTYGVCQIKTKCKAGEEEVDGRSKERDRKCRAIQIVTTSTLAPPTITTNTEPPNEENVNNAGVSILYWLLPLCLLIIVLIIVTICLCRKHRIYTQIQESFGHLCSQHPDTKNSSPNQELRPMNEISQNHHKHSNCNSNGSVNPEEQHLLDPSLTNEHATSTDEADTSRTFVTSVLDSEQPPLDSSLTNGHTTSIDDSENAETFLKSIGGNDEQFSSFGESIFDNEKSTSLEQNNRSLIGTQMSTASNHETSHGNTNNTGGNSVYDTAMTGFTGNIPESDLFHDLNTTQNHDNGEGPKTKAASSMTGNTEAPTNKTIPMATESFGNLCCQRRDTRHRSEGMNGKLQNGKKHSDCDSNGSVNQHLLHSSNGHAKDTDEAVNAETDESPTFEKSIVGNDDQYSSLVESIANNTGVISVYDTARTGSTGNNTTQNNDIGEGSKSKVASSVTRNTEAPTNIRPMATASRVTGNTEPPTNNPKPIAAVMPFHRSESSTSSRSQENTAPDNNDQRFPDSHTTVGGVDIETAVNERNSKLVCSAPYPYGQQSHVNMPPEEPSESLDDYVAAGGSSCNDDSIVTETGSEPTHVNMDDGNRYLPLEETSESLDDYVAASRNVIITGSESQFSVDQRTSAGDNGSDLRTLHGNLLAAPESTSTTSSNEPSLPSVESENPGQYN